MAGPSKHPPFLSNLNKYILQFGEVHFAVWTKCIFPNAFWRNVFSHIKPPPTSQDNIMVLGSKHPPFLSNFSLLPILILKATFAPPALITSCQDHHLPLRHHHRCHHDHRHHPHHHYHRHHQHQKGFICTACTNP